MLGGLEVPICGSMSMLVGWNPNIFGGCTSMLVLESLCPKQKLENTMSYNVHVNHSMIRIATGLVPNRLTWTPRWNVQKTMFNVHVNAKLSRKNS